MRRRILVVEDETRILDFLARGLSADGMTVDWARTGPAAVKRALEQRYDLVLLDLVLPQLNGLAVLERIQDARPELPVIVVSARGDVATKLKAFELGARDYVEKPFSLDELLARMRVHLVAPLERQSILRAGQLELDLATREARVGDVRALLSDREFRLLGYLAEHAGEAVSRERLLSEVWGYGFDPGSNVVDVCVRRIRRRLGDDVADRDGPQCGLPHRSRLARSAWRAPPSSRRTSSPSSTLAGWETIPIHVLLIAAGVFYAVRPPRTISSRDAVGFASALTLATIGNELLEGIEPVERRLRVVADRHPPGRPGLARRAPRPGRRRAEQLVAERERLLRRQERLMYDLSHELRTPATIARGHLELLEHSERELRRRPEIALDELARIDRIVERLLLLARAERGRLVELGEVEPEQFLEDVLLRWSETGRALLATRRSPARISARGPGRPANRGGRPARERGQVHRARRLDRAPSARGERGAS